MTIPKFVCAVVDGIRAEADTGDFPKLAMVAPHGGVFDEEEMRRVAVKTPSVFVACTAAGSLLSLDGEAMLVPLEMSAVVATSGVSRWDLAQVIAMEVYRLLHDGAKAQWANAAAKAPERGTIEATNMPVTKLDKMGVGMWVVSWRQVARLEPATAAEFADLLRQDITTQTVDEPDDNPAPGQIDANDRLE